MSSWGRGIANFGAHQRPIVGDTKTTTVGEDHLGWLLCDGRLLDPTDFQDLYKVIGYQFGRAGPLFRLPDPAGRVLGMIGTPNAANPSLTPRYMGGLSGEEMHTLVIPEMPSHTHTIANALTGITTNSDISGGYGYGIIHAGDKTYGGSTDTSAGEPSLFNGDYGDAVKKLLLTDPQHHHTAAYVGGSQPHNNIQPTLWVGNLFIYCGKTGFNRSKVYSGAFPNSGTNLY